MSLLVVQSPRRYGYSAPDSDATLFGLVANLRDDVPSPIDVATLSLTEANLKDRALADLFKRVGMEGVWQDVGKQNGMKLCLGMASDGETTAEAQNRLNVIMDVRNEIAHPTGAPTFPGPDQVLGTAVFMRALASTLTGAVRVHLAAFAPGL